MVWCLLVEDAVLPPCRGANGLLQPLVHAPDSPDPRCPPAVLGIIDSACGPCMAPLQAGTEPLASYD